MTLIVILNAVFAAFVLVGIVGLHLYAIAKDHAEHAGSSLIRVASDGPGRVSAHDRRARRTRVGRPDVGAVSVPRRAAGGQVLS